MAILNFDYNAAMRQASEIESVANEMRTLSTRQISSAIGAVKAGWTGEASVKFASYCDNLRIQIVSKAASLSATATALRTVAMRLEEAEQRAKQELLAQTLRKP